MAVVSLDTDLGLEESKVFDLKQIPFQQMKSESLKAALAAFESELKQGNPSAEPEASPQVRKALLDSLLGAEKKIGGEYLELNKRDGFFEVRRDRVTGGYELHMVRPISNNHENEHWRVVVDKNGLVRRIDYFIDDPGSSWGEIKTSQFDRALRDFATKWTNHHQ